ncbi:class I adenylate-forming enzyme family protein [Luteimonas mephitis]|uniref:class I adenylate-forming enzyme family protein n=1 Tax=Luteimonas mephitis TaxID=83615 RepID=UPI003A93DBF0
MRSLAQRLLATAHAKPRAAAIIAEGVTTDYATLAEAARRFAGALRAHGLGAGERVAIALPQGVEATAACYGSWLSGCVAVPLNPQAPARELAAALDHAGVSALVHEAGAAAAIPAAAAMATAPLRIAIGADADAGSQAWRALLESSPLHADVAPRSALAAIFYTSGTTGRPKGVALGHDNFASNVDAVVRYLGLNAQDLTVSVLPFQYSYGASVLHTHLAVGACLAVQPNAVFPQTVLAAIARERATGLSGVASTYALLLPHLAEGGHDLSSLRYLTHAGGPLTPALLARLRAALPGVRVFTMYGQTEATARLAWLPPERLDEKPGSVGQAISEVCLQVRDAAGTTLPAGVEGEVWASGPGVMAGYWNDPLATAAVLRDGWLRTGDVGHLDEDGFLFLAGRRADIIKTGAHRVHPQEVEQVLREFPGVADAAVVGVDDAVLGQVVKAFVVCAPGVLPSVPALREHCRAQMAAHKVPRHVAFVEALPRTSSGKVRRAALVAGEGLEEVR